MSVESKNKGTREIGVIILCGGKGSRMKEKTKVIPKPLVEVNGLPMLCHILNNLHRNNFKKVVLAVGYLGDEIRLFAKEYVINKPDMNIEISDAGEDASMLKRIYKTRPYFEQNNLIIYGDTFLDVDFEGFHLSTCIPQKKNNINNRKDPKPIWHT